MVAFFLCSQLVPALVEIALVLIQHSGDHPHDRFVAKTLGPSHYEPLYDLGYRETVQRRQDLKFDGNGFGRSLLSG